MAHRPYRQASMLRRAPVLALVLLALLVPLTSLTSADAQTPLLDAVDRPILRLEVGDPDGVVLPGETRAVPIEVHVQCHGVWAPPREMVLTITAQAKTPMARLTLPDPHHVLEVPAGGCAFGWSTTVSSAVLVHMDEEAPAYAFTEVRLDAVLEEWGRQPVDSANALVVQSGLIGSSTLTAAAPVRHAPAGAVVDLEPLIMNRFNGGVRVQTAVDVSGAPSIRAFTQPWTAASAGEAVTLRTQVEVAEGAWDGAEGTVEHTFTVYDAVTMQRLETHVTETRIVVDGALEPKTSPEAPALSPIPLILAGLGALGAARRRS